MDQLLLVGRKGGAQDVLIALQSLGVVQVDPIDLAHFGVEDGALGRFQPSSEVLAARGTWDRIAVRSTALLTALDVRDDVPAAGKSDLPLAVAEVAERLELVGGVVDQLVEERAALVDEIALVKATLPVFRDVAATLGQLESSRYLHGAATIVGSAALPDVRTALRDAVEGRIAFEEHPRGAKQVLLMVAVARSDMAALRAGLGRVGLAELALPERYRDLGVAKATHVMEERLAQHPKRLAAIADELRKLSVQHGPRLKAFQQMALNHRERLDRLGDLAEGRFSFALRGWVPSVDRPKVVDALVKQFGADLVVQHRPADEHHDEGVPVRLENAAWARPFQGLLSLFAPPKYGNFDPTWTLAVFFPLFFGVIVGDIGFGLLFALLATALRVRGQRGQPLSLGPLDMVIPAPALAPISTVMFWASGWTIVWGYVYGEFFGTFFEYWPESKPIFYTPLHSDNGWIEILLFRVEVFTPVILMAIGFGTLQILGGWVIRVIYGIRHHDMKHVYEGIGMFTGVASLVVFAYAFLTDNTGPVLNGAVAVGFGIFLVCVVLAKMPLMVIELVSNGGNILSYLRLFAVGLAAALVAKLATQLGFAIAGTLPVIGPILGILVGLFVHLIALVLKVIGYTLQPLRLQYVEFYTKFGFYDASGRPYQPFKILGGKS